jgi:hypothetical protein
VRSVRPAESVPVTPLALESHRDLEVYVIFTEVGATKAALKTATDLARDLSARLVLLVAKIVPWPLPLEHPPVSGEFTERVLSELAGGQKADITARVYLCRDRDPTIRRALEPGSLVVIGSRKRLRPNRTPRLARLLKRDGHDVILAGMSNQPARVTSRNVKSSLQAL